MHSTKAKEGSIHSHRPRRKIGSFILMRGVGGEDFAVIF